MSGFFKKLFNRVLGRKEDAAAEAPETAALPPPQPDPEPETKLVVEDRFPEPVTIEVPPPPAPVVRAPKPQIAPQPAKPVSKKAEARKPAAKVKIELRKPEPKRPPPKQLEPKKPEIKKPEPKTVTPKKAEPKAKAKAEPKTPEPPPRPTPKKAEQKRRSLEPLIVEEPVTPVPELEIKSPEPPIEEPAPVSEPVPELLPVPEPEPEPELDIVPVSIEPLPATNEPEQRRGWLSRLRHGLSKSSKSITSSITSIFTKRKLDAATLEELEDVLIQADLGLPMTKRIIKAVSTGRFDKEIEPEEVRQILASEVAKVLKPVEVPFNFGSEKPFVILVVGVNGSGKTTTIGKLGAIASREDFKVMFAACDTFRAAAIEQLTVWGQRVGAKTMSRPTGADSSGLAFDALKAAREDGTDILFIDTAGRLQNKTYLMDELDKVVRVLKKQDDTAPHAVLLVLDATTGQNAMAQAEVFTKVAGVTGVIMTKLDGTARGGILVAIAEKFKLPVHAIGVGEQIDDLQPFEAEAFARAIAGLEDK